MRQTIDGYEIRGELEPPHPRCTTSDPVYDAVNARGERVALKVLSIHFPLRDASSAKYLEAMNRARSIASPHVLRVVDAGFTKEGAPYYAMNFADGETLASVIDRGVTATARQTRTVLDQLGAAATAATVAGCTPHLHTRHILLTPSGARTWDFGVWPWRQWAHDLVAGTYTCGGGQLTWHVNITPNEAKGMPSNASNAAVQLALIAYSMLTARHYWKGDRDGEASPMEILMEVMRGPGDPPSTRTEVALPAGFDAWFVRCFEGAFPDAAAAATAFPS